MGKSKKKAKPAKSKAKAKQKDQKSEGPAKKKSWGAKETKGKERLERALLIPQDVQDQIIKDLPKMKYITASQLSVQYGIKISVIKPFLKDLQAQNMIDLVLDNNRIKLFTPAAKPSEDAG